MFGAPTAGFDAREVRLIEASLDMLAQLPVRGHASGIMDALAPCAPVAAGVLSIVRPGAQEAMTNHIMRLPPTLLESWMSTPRDLLTRMIAPVILSAPGEMRRDGEAFTGELREQFEVLRDLDAHSLGEGVGYKVALRVGPRDVPEHVFLSLISERGRRFAPRTAAMLAALNPAVQAAALRLELPLLARAPLYAQIVEEQNLGYLCLSTRGGVVETNRRAHELAARYRAVMGLTGRRRTMADLATRVLQHAARGNPWRLLSEDRRSILLVHVHTLAKEAHAVGEDVLLVVMTEVSDLPQPGGPPRDPSALARLTPRQREVAILLARGLAYKAVAVALDREVGTVRKHAERIYRLLDINSRAELTSLLK